MPLPSGQFTHTRSPELYPARIGSVPVLSGDNVGSTCMYIGVGVGVGVGM